MKIHTRMMIRQYVPMEQSVNEILRGIGEEEWYADPQAKEKTVCKLGAGVLDFRSDWSSRLKC